MRKEDIEFGEIYCFEWSGTIGLAIPYRTDYCGDFSPDGTDSFGYLCYVALEDARRVNQHDWFLEPDDIDRPATDMEKKEFLLRTIK